MICTLHNPIEHSFFFFQDFIYLFREKDSTQEGRGGERERILRLPAERGA